MALSVEETRRIAALARLRLSREEESLFTAQLGRVVDYIDQLSAFAATPPEEGRPSTPEAEDLVRESLPREAFLANAPDQRGGFFVVPAVIETGDE